MQEREAGMENRHVEELMEVVNGTPDDELKLGLPAMEDSFGPAANSTLAC